MNRRTLVCAALAASLLGACDGSPRPAAAGAGEGDTRVLDGPRADTTVTAEDGGGGGGGAPAPDLADGGSLDPADARADGAAAPDGGHPATDAARPGDGGDAATPTVDALGPDAQGADAATAVVPDPTELVFDLTVLHRVDLRVADEHLQALEDDRENRVPCDVVFDGVELPNSGVRQKGGIGSVSSLNGKPGFSLKFDEFDEDQDLYGLEKLVLNNSIQDPTFLHEHLGYEMSRGLGVPAHRTAHALVTLNGYACGIFVVAESVDDDFLRRHYGEEQDTGNLYEGPCCSDFVFDLEHMELKDEDDGRLRDDLEALARDIRDLAPAEFTAAIGARLDLRNFILGYALDAALGHWDGYAYNLNNHYIYHLPDADRFVFMPHGMDQVLQDVFFDTFRWPNGRLAQRVREDPELDVLFRDAVRHVATTVWDVDALSARIDGVRRVLAQAPQGDQNIDRDLRSFEGNIEGVLDTLVRRKAVLLQPGPEPPSRDCVLDVFADRAFHLCPFLMDAFTARDRCAELGLTLAVPRNDGEQAFLVQRAGEVLADAAWIGVDDEAREGRWRDPQGDALVYSAWAEGRPNGADDQNCAVIDIALGGGWNDRACGEIHGAVCAAD